MKTKISKKRGVRTCLVCRKRATKADLRKYIWNSEAGAVVLDKAQILPGRGAYCCSNGKCEEQFLKGTQRWKRAFRLR